MVSDDFCLIPTSKKMGTVPHPRDVTGFALREYYNIAQRVILGYG